MTSERDRIGRLLPGIATLRSYRRGWLAGDLAAGLTLTGILVPAGMAYAEASGLPPITGLYATIVPLLAYALVGPSRLLMLGPDSSLVPLILVALAPFAALAPAAVIPAAALLALLVGALVALGGIARLGFLADLLSSPARTGFLAGIAVIILVSQLPRLLGFPVEGDGPIARIPAIVAGVAAGRTDPASLVVGLAVSVAVVRVIEKETGKRLSDLASHVAGHSLGEYSALCAAGALSVADAARLLKLRGQSMQKAVPVGEGAMAALLGADLDQAKAIADEARQGQVCDLGNDNGPGQVVLSGSKAAIDRAIQLAPTKGVKKIGRAHV